jgi:hypothetical protein
MTLKFLKTIKNKTKTRRERESFFKKAKLGELNVIRNLAHALCRGKFPLCTKIKTKLCKHKQVIRDLANTRKLKSSHGLRRKLILHGGFLHLVVPAIISLLTSVGSQLLNRAIPT